MRHVQGIADLSHDDAVLLVEGVRADLLLQVTKHIIGASELIFHAVLRFVAGLLAHLGDLQVFLLDLRLELLCLALERAELQPERRFGGAILGLHLGHPREARRALANGRGVWLDSGVGARPLLPMVARVDASACSVGRVLQRGGVVQ